MSKRNLSQQTAERLYNSIVAEGTLRPGDKLPNEVELSQQLGVSRATLREAIRELAACGVLEVRRGGDLCVRRKWRTSRTSASLGWSGFRASCGTCLSCGPSSSQRPPGWPASGPRRRSCGISWREGRRWSGASGQDRTGRRRTVTFMPPSVRAAHNEFMVRLAAR